MPAGPEAQAAPMDPSMMGAQPGMPPADPSQMGEAMASPEQKQQLMDLIDQIRSQLAELNAVQFANGNQSQQQKNDLLKQIYMELQAAGVDLTDPQSVSDFLAKLRAKSPDIAALFEQAMTQLLGGEAPAPNDMQNPAGPMPDMNNGISDPSAAPLAPQG